MNIARFGLLICSLMVIDSAVVEAQQGRPQQGREQAGRDQRGGRDTLEARINARMNDMLRKQVGLSNAQMKQLAETNARLAGQRRALFERERQVRYELRREVAAADTSRNQVIARLLDQLMQIQRQRMELVEVEQRELATFMTPLQQARYYGMEEQLRRRMTDMRRDPQPHR